MKPTAKPMRWWKLTREEAESLSRQRLDQNRLPWTEPVSITRRPLGGWQVMTNADQRGGNVFVWITRSGRVSGGEQVTRR